MANTKDLGPFFAHRYTYPTKKAPLLNRTHTQEIEPPYRFGRSIILRLPFTQVGIVLGAWTSRRSDEDEALFNALNAHVMTPAGDVTDAGLFAGGGDAPAQA